jgi:hypothetical protein
VTQPYPSHPTGGSTPRQCPPRQRLRSSRLLVQVLTRPTHPGSISSLSLAAITKRCLQPMGRSVVCTETCPRRIEFVQALRRNHGRVAHRIVEDRVARAEASGERPGVGNALRIIVTPPNCRQPGGYPEGGFSKAPMADSARPRTNFFPGPKSQIASPKAPAVSMRSTLTPRLLRAIVRPSGVREGGANPPLPRNCKRRELEPIC